MKIALAQTKIAWENKKKNIEKAAILINEQSRKGTELILFPEMSFTGFSMNTDVTKESGKEMNDHICSMAVENQMAIGYGWVKDCGNICENHYSVVDQRGNIVCDYAKIHPFSFSGEDKYFRGGNQAVVFGLNGMNFSVFICYDLRFPEVFQSVSRDADAIIVPANWPAGRSSHWKTLLKARAIENQVYVLGINCVGKMGGIEYYGESCAINPNGEVLAICEKSEAVILCNIVSDVGKYRDEFQMKKDRRLDLYKRLYRRMECGSEEDA